MPIKKTSVAVYLDDDETADGKDHVNSYTLGEVLGKGSTGTVRRCISQEDGVEYVMKSMSKRKLLRSKEPAGVSADGSGTVLYITGLERAYREIKIMSQLNHVNLLQLFEVIDDPNNDALSMVMEYMPGGALMRYQHRDRCFVPAVASAAHVALLMRDLLRGLEAMHAAGVCHRDIKPENCLLKAAGLLKIGDFGCAEHFPRESNPGAIVSHTAGTPAFWAPECICPATGGLDLGLDMDGLALGEAKDGGIGGKEDDGDDMNGDQGAGMSSQFSCYSADCWAAGALLYCLVYARPPFASDEPLVLFDLIASAPLHTEPHDNLFPGALEVLRGLLDKDPTLRWTVADALAALQ